MQPLLLVVIVLVLVVIVLVAIDVPGFARVLTALQAIALVLVIVGLLRYMGWV